MTDLHDLEERLRRTFQAVAEQSAPEPAIAASPTPTLGPVPVPGVPRPLSAPKGPVRRHQRLLITVASVAALALVIALALTFGPHNATPPPSHHDRPAASSHQNTNKNQHQNTPASLLPSMHPMQTVTPTTTAPLPTTQQITYQPFDGSELDPTLHVAAEQSGECFEYGGGADGRYLYRCGTMQPCFAGADGTSAPLACPVGTNPLTNDVILWQATTVDTADFIPATTKTPWAMQFTDGVVCYLVNAAWSGLGPFACDSSAGAGGAGAPSGPADCHQPTPGAASTTGASLWTAECQDQETATSPFTPQSVAKIWF